MDLRIRAEMIEILPRLRRFASGLTGSVADGDDLVQATCERAIINLDKWRPDTRLDSWMFRIAQNIHRNTIRDSRNRHRILTEHGDMVGPAAEQSGDSDDRITWRAVRQILGELVEEQRAVLLLVCVEGYSYTETSAILDVPVGTVTSRLARARQAVLERLAAGEDKKPISLTKAAGDG